MKLKFMHILIYTLGYLFAGISIVAIPFYYLYINNANYRFMLRGSSNLLGNIALGASIAAVGIWVIRKIYLEIKKREIKDYNITKQSALFLRKHHILIGWVVIFASTAHGIYFLLNYPNRQNEIYTGLFIWLALVFLAGIGAFFDFKLKDKRKHKKIRIYHITFSVLFLLGLIIHVM